LRWLLIKYGSGVQFLNGANGTIENSTIEVCTQGIYFSNAEPQILQNEIINPTQNGIYGVGSGYAPFIYGNKITRTTGQSYSGINLSNGIIGYVTQNDISGFTYGMYYGGGVAVNCVDEYWNQYFPNNRIRNCYSGIVVGWGSSANLEMEASQNSIYNQSSNDVYVYQSSTFYGSYNWWGGSNPSVYVDGSSNYYNGINIDYDPWDGINIIKDDNSNKKSLAKTSGSGLPITTGSNNPLRAGFDLLKENRFNDAFEYFKSHISDVRLSHVIVGQIFKLKKNESLRESTVDFLKTYLSKRLDDPRLMLFLAGLYYQEKDYTTAMSLCDQVINTYPDDMEAIDAKIMRINHRITVMGDIKNADVEFKGLMTTHGDNEDYKIQSDLEMVKYLLQTVNSSSIPFEKSVAKKEVHAAGLSAKNYPNPFNPTTVITYSIDSPNNVTLTVYDYLGREVQILVNSFKDKGVYDATFNATNLASGVYFYTLRTGSKLFTHKMLLTK
jgi:tetratricopeptide (TPR) repeat protein